MCDLSDVEQALVDLVAQALYPQGTSQPSAVGINASAYRGWPLAAQLDADMTATKVVNGAKVADPTANITVFPLAGMTRLTTRYPREWRADGPAPTSLTAAVSGHQVTLGGAAGLAQLVGIRCLGMAYVYQAEPTDTPESTAAALAALVPGAAVSGATVTCPADPKLKARVGGYATIRRELRRQVQGFRVTCWCPDRVSRDAVATCVDQAIAQHTFLTLPNGSGRLTYAAADVDDVPQKDRLWRRDFRVTVEYPTTEVQVAPAMMWGIVSQIVDEPIADTTV